MGKAYNIRQNRPMTSRAVIQRRLSNYAALMRVNKPIGSLLLLWPTLWALWIAGKGRPDPELVVIFVLGVFVMRAAGCVINDIADQKLDRQVARTRGRPLAVGLVTRGEAVFLFGGLMGVASALAMCLNPLAIGLACAGAFLACTYPFTKRITDLPQIYLGVAFGWGIPMGFAAQQGEVPLVGWVLLAANICWAIAYDTMYAMTDREDDMAAGARSSAILFGRADRIWIAVFQAGTLTLLGGVGIHEKLGMSYYIGLAGALGFAMYQQYLIRARERLRCFSAFLNNNWFGASVFAGLSLSYVI